MADSKYASTVESIMQMVRDVAGVEPSYEPSYDLLQLDPRGRVQVRLDKNNAPQEMVDRYRFQMSQSEFPPILVSADRRMIDGNTRGKARLARDEIYTPAIIVPLSWDDGSKDERLRLILLGQVANNMNGKPLSEVERIEAIRNAIKDGWPNARIVYQLGFDEKTVRNLRDEHEARERLAKVGFEDPNVPPAVIRAMGKHGVNLDDDAFAAMAGLAIDAGFNAGEVATIATSLRESPSAETRAERLGREREAQQVRIAEKARGGNGHPPLSRRLKGALHLLTESSHPAEDFVERNPDAMVDYLRVLEIAHASLGRIIELQAAAMPAAEDEAAE